MRDGRLGGVVRRRWREEVLYGLDEGQEREHGCDSLIMGLKQLVLGGDGMREGENAPIVLVAAREELLNKLKNALADTVGLLHAETRREAITLLERLRTEISLAIVELEHSDGWDLIEEHGKLTAVQGFLRSTS